MKIGYPIIIAIFLMLVTLSVSGCCCCTSVPTIPGTPAIPGVPTISGTTATPTATATSTTTNVDMSKFKVLEYKMSSTGEGQQSVAFNVRMEITGNQEHVTMTMEGQSKPVFDQTIPIGQSTSSSQPGGAMVSDLTSPEQSTWVNAGQVTVNVPKGTFHCTKYTSTSGSTTNTYWVANNAAVPIVKMTSKSDNSQFTMELVDYQ